MGARSDRHLMQTMCSSGLVVLSCNGVHTNFHVIHAHMQLLCTPLLQLASVDKGQLKLERRTLQRVIVSSYLGASHSQPIALKADCNLGTLVDIEPMTRASRASRITHLTQGSNSCACTLRLVRQRISQTGCSGSEASKDTSKTHRAASETFASACRSFLRMTSSMRLT